MERKKLTAARVMTTIVSVLLLIGAIIKIIPLPKVEEDFTKLGVGEYTVLLGFVELVFGALFLFRKTMKFGFLLLSSYLGGAMAVHVAHAEAPFQPAFLLAVIWVTAYLRNHSVFLDL